MVTIVVDSTIFYDNAEGSLGRLKTSEDEEVLGDGDGFCIGIGRLRMRDEKSHLMMTPVCKPPSH